MANDAGVAVSKFLTDHLGFPGCTIEVSQSEVRVTTPDVQGGATAKIVVLKNGKELTELVRLLGDRTLVIQTNAVDGVIHCLYVEFLSLADKPKETLHLRQNLGTLGTGSFAYGLSIGTLSS